MSSGWWSQSGVTVSCFPPSKAKLGRLFWLRSELNLSIITFNIKKIKCADGNYRFWFNERQQYGPSGPFVIFQPVSCEWKIREGDKKFRLPLERFLQKGLASLLPPGEIPQKSCSLPCLRELEVTSGNLGKKVFEQIRKVGDIAILHAIIVMGEKQCM